MLERLPVFAPAPFDTSGITLSNGVNSAKNGRPSEPNVSKLPVSDEMPGLSAFRSSSMTSSVPVDVPVKPPPPTMFWSPTAGNKSHIVIPAFGWNVAQTSMVLSVTTDLSTTGSTPAPPLLT